MSECVCVCVSVCEGGGKEYVWEGGREGKEEGEERVKRGRERKID